MSSLATHTPAQATEKIKHYCAYQERCHSEVQSKLFEYGISKKEADEIIGILISENYLNEERFAIAFAGGKFRMKQWGKTKIKYELQQRKVSSYIITKSLATINSTDYNNTIKKLYTNYFKKLKGSTKEFKSKKTISYLKQKGFEFDAILNAIAERG